MNLRTFFAFEPDDTDEVRLEKFVAFLVAGLSCVAGAIWGVMYYFIFGWGLTMALPLAFVVIVGAALVVSHLTKNHYYAVYAQMLCIIYITALIQWSIGGIFDSGFVMVWSFLGPLTALMFLPFRASMIWFGLFLLNLAITVGFNDFFAGRGQVVAETTRNLFFTMNLGVSSLVVFIFAGYFVTTAIETKAREKVLKAELQKLVMVLDREKMDKAVAQVINSDFFVKLQEEKDKR